MNEQQLNLAIAKALGWTYLRVCPPHPRRKDIKSLVVGQPPATSKDRSVIVPDWAGSLDVMHELEKTLQHHELWLMTALLAAVIKTDKPIAHASALDRAKAILQILERKK